MSPNHDLCPQAGADDVARAVGLCRGWRQRFYTEAMGTAEGFLPPLTGRWSGADWRAFHGTRRRLALGGVRTVQRPLGTRGGGRWVIDGCPLSDMEVTVWQLGFADYLPAMLAAGLTSIPQARVYLLEGFARWTIREHGPVLAVDVAARVEPALRVLARTNLHLFATVGSAIHLGQWGHLADLAEAADTHVLAVLAPGWVGDLDGLLTAAVACTLPERPGPSQPPCQ